MERYCFLDRPALGALHYELRDDRPEPSTAVLRHCSGGVYGVSRSRFVQGRPGALLAFALARSTFRRLADQDRLPLRLQDLHRLKHVSNDMIRVMFMPRPRTPIDPDRSQTRGLSPANVGDEVITDHPPPV